EADIRKMLNHRINTNNSSADQATIDSLIDDLLHHKRQNSEDSGVGEGRNSINRTPDALSSTDYVDDPLFLNQAGASRRVTWSGLRRNSSGHGTTGTGPSANGSFGRYTT
ncbi:unnamed protein product, partial [Rotaria sp. Silwood1]